MGRSPKRPHARALDGILLLDKAEGISSNQALQQVRRLFDARKAGHTGSLDVLATGLLPVCFGEATKLCAFLLDADKRYLATIRLGVTTDTGDAEGRVLVTSRTGAIDEMRVRDAMRIFVGEIAQVPPMYSALKRDGRPLYELARAGRVVERAARRVVIHAFELLAMDDASIRVAVHCSKGTYIRSLAEDLGRHLGCGAHVTALRRTAAGPFTLDAAARHEEIASRVAAGAGDELLLPMDAALPEMPKLKLAAPACAAIRQGQPIPAEADIAPGLVRLYDSGDRFVGLGKVDEKGELVPRRLIRAA